VGLDDGGDIVGFSVALGTELAVEDVGADIFFKLVILIHPDFSLSTLNGSLKELIEAPVDAAAEIGGHHQIAVFYGYGKESVLIRFLTGEQNDGGVPGFVGLDDLHPDTGGFIDFGLDVFGAVLAGIVAQLLVPGDNKFPQIPTVHENGGDGILLADDILKVPGHGNGGGGRGGFGITAVAEEFGEEVLHAFLNGSRRAAADVDTGADGFDEVALLTHVGSPDGQAVRLGAQGIAHDDLVLRDGIFLPVGDDFGFHAAFFQILAQKQRALQFLLGSVIPAEDGIGRRALADQNDIRRGGLGFGGGSIGGSGGFSRGTGVASGEEQCGQKGGDDKAKFHENVVLSVMGWGRGRKLQRQRKPWMGRRSRLPYTPLRIRRGGFEGRSYGVSPRYPTRDAVSGLCKGTVSP